MTTVPEIITLAQIDTALRALGFDLKVTDLSHVDIGHGTVAVVGYSRTTAGDAIPGGPYPNSSATWRVEVPIEYGGESR